MTDDFNNAPSLSYFRTSTRRKAVHREQLAEVSVDSVKAPFLLQVHARIEGVLLHGWATDNRELIDDALLKYGALLFRGFLVPDLTEFRCFVKGICGELLEYQERSSPRTLVQPGIYSCFTVFALPSREVRHRFRRSGASQGASSEQYSTNLRRKVSFIKGLILMS